MADINKVGRHFIEKELSFQEDSSDFLDWLDGRDASNGESDGFITASESTCISEDDLRNEISEIETTPDRRKKIEYTVKKFVPTCEMYLEGHEKTRQKSLNKTPLTRRTPIGPEIIEEDRIEAFHGPEEGFFFARVDVPYFKVKGMVSFTDTRGIFSKAARTTKQIDENNGNSMRALLGPLGIAPSTVAELSAMVESSAVAKSSAGCAGVPLLFGAAALATGLTPQSFRIDLQLIIPKIKIGLMTIYVKVPKHPQKSEEVVIKEWPGGAREILIPDGFENPKFVEERPDGDHKVWIPKEATEEGDPKPARTPTEGVKGINNSSEADSSDNATSKDTAASSDVDDDESPPADTKELEAGDGGTVSASDLVVIADSIREGEGSLEATLKDWGIHLGSPAAKYIEKIVSSSKRNAGIPTANTLIDSLMAYLNNGEAAGMGTVSKRDEPLFDSMVSALTTFTPKGIDHQEWRTAVERSVRKWIKVYDVNEKDIKPLIPNGWKILSERIGEKLKRMKDLGLPISLRLRLLYREPVEVVERVWEKYSRSIATVALKNQDPEGTAAELKVAAEKIAVLYDELRADHPNHPMLGDKGNKNNLIYAVVHAGIRGETMGKEFFEGIKTATEKIAVLYDELRADHPNHPMLGAKGNKNNLIYAAVHAKIRGETMGKKFFEGIKTAAEKIAVLYDELRADHPNHPMLGAKGNKNNLIYVAVNARIRGEKRAQAFFDGMKTAAEKIAVLYDGLRADHPDHPTLGAKGNNNNLIYVAVNAGIRGEARAQAFFDGVKTAAEKIAVLYDGLRADHPDHPMLGDKGNKNTLIYAAVNARIRGEKRAQAFFDGMKTAAEKIANLYNKLPADHPMRGVKGNKNTLIYAAVHFKIRGEKRAQAFFDGVKTAAEKIANLYNKLPADHPMRGVKGNKNTLISKAVHAGIRGETIGKEFFDDVKAAVEEVDRLSNKLSLGHSFLSHRKKFIADKIINKGIRTKDAAKKKFEEELALYGGVNNE